MARVTVEDCIDKVENRFDLVLLAGHRARMGPRLHPDPDPAAHRHLHRPADPGAGTGNQEAVREAPPLAGLRCPTRVRDHAAGVGSRRPS